MSAPANVGGGRLTGRFVGLGISGSIAAYKAAELVRLLRAEGADVQVMATPSATRFVAPLTLATLSGHAVEDDVLALMTDGRIGHVVTANAADAIVVAPATAHWLGAMANGLAADVVTAACLATPAPVVVAPAMDGEMYAHPATQGNVARLRDEFHYVIVEPEAGPLASGQVGVGRLAELPRIVDAVVAAIGGRPIRAPDLASRPPPLGERPRPADLEGRRVIVTAGGTIEPIDPVRFIGNRSTGKMGAAIAQAALDRGASVDLITASVTAPLPAGARIVRVETADEMRSALLDALTDGPGRPSFDALVMAAAVADFRAARISDTKLVRDEGLTLDLAPTPDILADVARFVRGRGADGRPSRPAVSPRPILVGFAAETGSLDRVADKLRAKGVDLMVANDVAEAGSGFGTDTNQVVVHSAVGEPETWPLLPKREVADRLLDRIVTLLDVRDAVAPSTEAHSPPARTRGASSEAPG